MPTLAKISDLPLAAPLTTSAVVEAEQSAASVRATVSQLLALTGGLATTFTATQTFSGSSSTLAAVFNDTAVVATVSATAATGTINYDVTTQSLLFYTSNASGNWTVNFRGSSGTNLNSLMSAGQSMTVMFLVQQGGTAFFNNAVQIDGVSVTPRWLNGAPSAGNAGSVDMYTYNIVKTGSAAFSVFASLTRYV